MIRSPALEGAARVERHVAILMAFLLVGLVLSAGLALGAINVMVALEPPGASISLADGSADVSLDTRAWVALEGWDARLVAATLMETGPGRDGPSEARWETPIRVETIRDGARPGDSEVMLSPATGALRPDTAYRLEVRGTALAPAVPWPSPVAFERAVRFSTARSPRPIPQPERVKLGWGQPLRIGWSAPIERFRVEVQPAVAFRSWVDPADRRASFVQLDDPRDSASYEVAVVEAIGENGVRLQQPAIYQVAAPPRPRLLELERERTLEVGAPLELRWSEPLERLRLEVDPPVAASWSIDPRAPSTVRVALEGLEQEARYRLTVVEAVARGGAPLAEPETIQITTPPALAIEAFDVGTEASRVSVKARPTIVFDEPVRDRRKAAAAIAVDPPTPGRLEWRDDRRARFVPLRDWPFDAEITFQVRGGPDGPRARGGGFLAEPASFTFKTETDKLIDVDVTAQVLKLIQRGRVVNTFPVATGVPGADTPLGEFFVEYKMPVARFRGTNVSGSTYDIPDVKWVLAFMGDYTIHGAYWRSAFGTPGSNGCVSLADENARTVFEWAPEGTRVHIHY